MSTKAVALAPPATLAEVLDRIAAMDTVPRQRRHDLLSAVRQVARLLGCLPADVPANPEALKRGLNLMTPAGAGMSKSRWRNVRALLTAALDLTNAKVVRGRRLTELAPSWLALIKRVGDPFERARLSRFFSYASTNGIEPNQVDDQTVADFAERLKRNSMLQRQTQIVRDSCIAWNRCAESIEGWLATRLTVPNRRRKYALPSAAYPASFLADVDAYLAHLAGRDLFATSGRGPASPSTLEALRLHLFEMAAALVHSGRAPETIRSLADLAEPEALKTALTFFWSRNGNRKTGQLHNFALDAVAFILNYVPLLGPAGAILIFLFAGSLTIASTWQALLPAALYGAHPCDRGRDGDADASRQTIHAQSGSRYLPFRVLVLAVGRPGRDSFSANSGDHQDRLRSRSAAGRSSPYSRGLKARGRNFLPAVHPVVGPRRSSLRSRRATPFTDILRTR
jgi:hypothetical protein